MSDTTLNINPDEITGVLRRHLEGFRPEVEKQQVGRIVEVGDGIARISGLPNTAVNELLEFEGGVLGLALSRPGRPGRSWRSPSATACSVAWSILSANQLTAGGRSRRIPRAASRFRRPASSPASR